MYKRIKQYIISEKGERGVAVLFALTFMALLLVMALSFAANSLLDQKVAYNNASASAADMVAESALNRIVSLAELYCPDTDDVMVSRDSAGSNDDLTGDYSYFQGITYNGETVIPTTKLADGTTANPDWTTYVNSKIKTDINWIYVTHDTVVDGAPTNKIFGRYAYAIIPEGLLTPSKLVKDTFAEVTYPELRFGNKINEINIQSLDSTFFNATRTPYFDYTGMTSSLMPGCANWISLQNILRTIPVSAYEDQQAFRTWFIPNAAQEREAYWIDLNNDNIVDAGIDTNGDGTLETASSDYNGDGTTDAADGVELFQRFNLRGFKDSNGNGYYDSGIAAESDSNMWNKVANSSSNMCKYLLLDYSGDGVRDRVPPMWVNRNDYTGSTGTDYSNPAFTDIHATDPNLQFRVPGLLWLANFNDGNGTFSSLANRRRQIAANLVDYCDTDSVPTSDSVDWSTTAPTFTGNEMTRYLNEIGVELTIGMNVVPNGSNKWDCTLDVSAKIKPELINLYGLDAQTNLSLIVVGSIQVDVLWPKSNSETVTLPLNGTYAICNGVAPQTHTGTGMYALTSVSTSSVYSNTDVAVPKGLIVNKFEAKNVNITLTSVILRSGSVDIDYSAVNKSSSFPETSGIVVVDTTILNDGDSSTSTGVVNFSFQTDDPRQNLNSGDWAVQCSTALGVSAGTLGSQNTTVTAPTATTDNEALASLSTAFIRNAPMRSPWELGFIHRGAKWETLNLKAYNNTLAIGPISGGSTPYASGDANILDQIKMTDEAKSSTKVNIAMKQTATSNNVLQALLHKIKIGTVPSYPSGRITEATVPTPVSPCPTVAAPTNITTEINAADALTVADAIANTTKNTSATAWKTRAAVANVAALTNGTCGATASPAFGQNTDATKEELIGKFINLTKVPLKCANDPSAFYAMGINSPDYFTVIIVAQTIKDIGGNITISKNDGGTIRSRTVQYGTFDYDSTNDLYYDEIVSTRKLLARIYRDPFTGKCKIVSYSYLD